MNTYFRQISYLLGAWFICAFTMVLHAQTGRDTTTVTQDTLPIQIRLQVAVPGAMTIELDKFNNLYVATENNRIFRYDSLGQKSIFEYSNNRMGVPQSIDASNPLNVLLYYPDFQTIVFLSRTLSQESVLQLSNLGYVQVPVIATAADGNIWLMDMLDFKLKKITPDGRLIRESQELNLMVAQLSQPFQIVDTGDHVYIADKQCGIIQLDGFGQFMKYTEAKGIHSLGAKGEYILYGEGHELVFSHTKVPEEKRVVLPKGVRLHRNGRFYRLSESGEITLY